MKKIKIKKKFNKTVFLSNPKKIELNLIEEVFIKERNSF